jgi:L-iditol 2-dehydrogenase
MRALVRSPAGVRLEDVPPPAGAEGRGTADAQRQVVIDVAYAGVCRTDLAVADGELPVARVIMGHELSGWLDGRPVTAIPFDGDRWLGVHVDGAFADRVAVPAAAVVPVPAAMDLRRAAFVEPVAAALGALPCVPHGARVLVSGAGRIAELTARVLAGRASVHRHVPGDAVPSGFDVAIEHGGGAPALLAALRRGGTLVVKSRARSLQAFDVGELVARELVVRGASHGSFTAAVDLLASGQLVVDDLLAAPRPLDDFAHVLAAARDESVKQMFAVARCAG